MRPSEGAADRVAPAGAAGQHNSIASVDAPAEAGKQVAKTLHRRHLDESQRALVGKRLSSMSHGGDRRSDQAANLPVVTQSEAARLMSVSERSIRSAGQVLDHGAPELLNVSRPTESAQICAVTQTQAALTRLGEMLKATPKNEGGRPPQKTGSDWEPVSSVPTLADLATDKKVRL
ncbi:MAG: hypothetical protein AMXMBFR72_38410 [Betaproteobacteria bacterium]